ncbi:MAG TPA: endonuclease/exonuclease/phosphatase family protein [Pyrinomonadaceae bacterium]|nr:endonuclease/exonuclease/phosphatase family protein [Pyrinomonadaceae bacterium]
MRVITWNINKANTGREETWNYLCALNPDLVFLQEVGWIPDFIENEFNCLNKKAAYKNGQPQSFATAILVRKNITLKSFQLLSELNWVNRELDFFSGNFLAAEIILENGFHAQTISVHSPAWRIEPARLVGIDINEIKLKNNSDVWGTELLWAALNYMMPENNLPWIIGGDFNFSVTFDLPKPRGNQEIIDRMNKLGLVECLFHKKEILTPTFKNANDKKIIHQIDHLFVSADLISNLEFCDTGNSQHIFENSLSDHLPIIADFSV